MLKKKDSPKIDEAVRRSVDFEVTVSDLARRSERRAWWVAGASMVVSLILLGGYFYMLPLKEKVPYIVLADAYTGTSQLARLTDDVLNPRLTSSEALNRSNVAHYIMARESYDYPLVNLRDWTTVLTMSGPRAAGEYTQLYQPNNPSSPYTIYGRDRSIRVKILSIVLLGASSNNGTPNGATVRFQRSVFNKITGQSTPLDSKIATLQFVYKPNLKMDEQDRVENPLGFQVTDYRVDNDYATPPPPEVPASAASTADAAGNQQAAEPSASVSDPTQAAAATPSAASGAAMPSPAQANGARQ